MPGATANTANCGLIVSDLTDVGSYTGSASPNGTFDQGGNVWEWNEMILVGSDRALRGGSLFNPTASLAASARLVLDLSTEGNHIGFRVAIIPEPGTGLLVMTGLLGLACRKKRHA